MARETPTHTLGDHAVVIGGSMAGLLAARVLADHFNLVTVVERDQLAAVPTPRTGVPQACHQHALLLQGQRILDQLFPGLGDELVAAGAPLVDMAADMAWLTPAGWGVRFPSHLTMLACSRDLLEWGVRARLARHERVRVLDGHEVPGLLAAAGTRVTGVRVRAHGAPRAGTEGEAAVDADLVVDASGRGSRAPQWLVALGYAPPAETVVNAFLGYASRIYRRPAGFGDAWQGAYVQVAPPASTRGGVLFPLEGGRCLVTLAGGGRDYPPTDEAGFLAFARSLRSPLLYEAIKDTEPLSPIVGTRATQNRLRHYERLARQPDGLVVLGDAACAFNPVYAQGMTTAALGALTLDRCLRERRGRGDAPLAGLPRHFQGQLARVNAVPWTLATGEDFRYATTEGAPPPAATRVVQRYMDQVIALTTERADVRLALLEAFHMLTAPTTLFRPAILARVLWRMATRHPAVSIASAPGGRPEAA